MCGPDRDGPAENAHLPTLRRKRVIKRFTSARHLKRLVLIHDQVANRHNCPRQAMSSSGDRAHGLRVIIFNDDHEPAHVHVSGDGQAKINLIGADGYPTLVWTEDMKATDLQRAVQLVRDQKELFLAKGREIHG
jgi:hypothetical protein